MQQLNMFFPASVGTYTLGVSQIGVRHGTDALAPKKSYGGAKVNRGSHRRVAWI